MDNRKRMRLYPDLLREKPGRCESTLNKFVRTGRLNLPVLVAAADDIGVYGDSTNCWQALVFRRLVTNRCNLKFKENDKVGST